MDHKYAPSTLSDQCIAGRVGSGVSGSINQSGSCNGPRMRWVLVLPAGPPAGRSVGVSPSFREPNPAASSMLGRVPSLEDITGTVSASTGRRCPPSLNFVGFLPASHRKTQVFSGCRSFSVRVTLRICLTYQDLVLCLCVQLLVRRVRSAVISC